MTETPSGGKTVAPRVETPVSSSSGATENVAIPERIKDLQKKIQGMEADGSLDETSILQRVNQKAAEAVKALRTRGGRS